MLEIAKNLAFIVLGSFVEGLAVNMFFKPINLVGGGFTALGILLHANTGFSIALFLLLINIPIFLVAYLLVYRKFFLYSLVGMMSFSLALRLTDSAPQLSSSLITCVIAGGIMTGIGAGLRYRENGSAGGIDVIIRIINKYFSYSIGGMNLLVNAVILTLSAYFIGIDLVIASIATIYISSKIMNTIIEGPHYKISVNIVSNKADEIAVALTKEFEKGVTILQGRGGYSGELKEIVMCTIYPYQTPKLKSIVLKIEPSAFITINEIVSAIGGGFKENKLG